jgi:predicted nucleic acid-binding protein
MTALTIRDVPEDAVRTMKIRAAQAGQSLQAYLRSLIMREAADLPLRRLWSRPAGRRPPTSAPPTSSPQSTRDEPDVDHHRLLGHDRTAGSEDADRRCHRSPGDRSADPVSPYVLDGKVISALLELIRGQKISEREADAALSSYRAFPVEQQDVLPLWPRLKSLHANLSACDAQYVALAEALHVPLITADARIKRSGVARCNVEVFGVHT